MYCVPTWMVSRTHTINGATDVIAVVVVHTDERVHRFCNAQYCQHLSRGIWGRDTEYDQHLVQYMCATALH